MLHDACNMPYSDNIVQNKALRYLEARLPGGWHLQRCHPSDLGMVVNLMGPDGKQSELFVQARQRLDPRDVPELARRMDTFRGSSGLPLVVSPFLTTRARQLLKEANLSFLDLTGNCWFVSSSPGLFICTSGQETNPNPEDRPVRSLKGPVAGRVVRALCDFHAPVGIRELAARSHADPGYVSRLLTVLEREALIVRGHRALVQEVKWRELILRWAGDFSPFSPSRVYRFLDPRGLNAFFDKLRQFPQRYAITGSAAAAVVAPLAPARLAVSYVDDPEEASDTLGLRPAEAGVNVMLVSPFDPVVYERILEKNGLVFASLSQVAADLLHAPGRAPEEATALLDWMASNESVWRT